MQKRIIVVRGNPELAVETAKVFGAQRFRWSCTCRGGQSSSWTLRQSSREATTTLEALRQHWTSVHVDLANRMLINWYEVNKRLPWLLDTNDRDENGEWVIPTIKSNDHVDYFDPGLGDPGWRVVATNATVSMKPLEERKGMSRLSDIEARMRELEKEAARYARFPKTDPWPVGTVVTYNWSPLVNDEAMVYTYAVLKAGNGDWYWTGAERSGKRTGMCGDYDTLVENLAGDNVSDIRVATPDDFDPLFPELEDLVGLEGTETVDQVSEKLAEKGIYVPVVKRTDG